MRRGWRGRGAFPPEASISWKKVGPQGGKAENSGKPGKFDAAGRAERAGGHPRGGPARRLLSGGAKGRAHIVRPYDGGGKPPPYVFALPVGADVPIGPRAATWGRPYENFGPLSSVGADLRVRPPVLGAHIGAPLHGGGGSPLPSLAFGHLPLIGGVVPRPTWCVFRRARRPGGPRRAQWSRPTKIPVHDSSLRGGPQARRGNPYLRPRRSGFPRPLRGLGMTVGGGLKFLTPNS